MSLIDYLVGILAGATVIAAVVIYIKKRKSGCSSCANCPYSANCEKQTFDKNKRE